jgi:hypothetical protein
MVNTSRTPLHDWLVAKWRCVSIKGVLIDNSHYRLILKLGMQGDANKSPQLEWAYTKMSKIAKFGCEML